jgi:hypothetical protein
MKHFKYLSIKEVVQLLEVEDLEADLPRSQIMHYRFIML